MKPWGWYRELFNTGWFWVKVIKVNDGHRTSWQWHRKRAEVHIGIKPRSFNYYGKRSIHEMTPGLYIELAWGKTDESDIIRVSDDYGRT